ncbi:MAG: FMN reductase [Chlamydiales bacterium]|jgi:FMN reductase
MTTISCISGSLREGSHSQKALQRAMALLESHGEKPKLIDLRTMNLPFCNGEDKYPEYPDVEHLRQAVAETQGLILCSPEYHGGISGVLKNTLDLLDYSQIRNKYVGIISILGGGSSFNAVNSLTQTCHHLHAWVIPRPVIITHADTAFNHDGNFAHSDHEERLNALVLELINAVNKGNNNPEK